MPLLMYAITMTCPDFRYALSILSQYYANPNTIYIAGIIQLLRYVHDTLHYDLIYIKSQSRYMSYIDGD